MNRRVAAPLIIGAVLFFLLALITIPMLVVGGSTLLFADSDGSDGSSCGTTSAVTQPAASTEAEDSIPANYLKWFQTVGLQYNVPWTILAGIGEVESNDGRTTLPGVNSGSNAYGAAGPMQIGIGGASTNTWGGAPIHPASEVVDGVATDEDGGPDADVYDPADAIAGAAKYLIEHGVQTDPDEAIFAYNHADWYVSEVLSWASTYASGGFTVADSISDGTTTGSTTTTTTTASTTDNTACAQTSALSSIAAPNAVVATAIDYAEDQLGKPYLYGGTGPDAFDCSGLVMMAYESAGVDIPRTAAEQFQDLPHVAASKVVAGDLVFFSGADGTPTAPGHVGLVIGKNLMIEAYATGTTIRVSTFGESTSPEGDNVVVGYAQPWPNSDNNEAVSG